MKRKSTQFIGQFVIGGLGYNAVEILWRGYSHWSMFLLGGTCFHLIGKIDERLHHRGVIPVAVACSGAVTAAEFVSGCLLNLHWKLDVWDYSHMFGNIRGQVCLLYSVLWGGLSLLTIPLYRCTKLMLSTDSSH